MPDIFTSPENDGATILFEAETQLGRDWLGSDQIPVPSAEAADFRAQAIAAGLVVAAIDL